MDSAILSATSGLIGSLVGGVSTFAASWLSTRNQYRTQTLVQQVVRREALYAEFIGEATKCLTDAWSHQAVSPEVIAGLFGAAERIRLMASEPVIEAADEVIRHVIEAYSAPVRTFEDLRQSVEARQFRNPLRDFTQACRSEPMVALHGHRR
jgi:hypothetical protein